MKINIQDLMDRSGVKFGTSGARGLAKDMTDFVCYVYTCGFLQYLESRGDIKQGQTHVAIAGDLRPSTDRIMDAVRRAAHDMGYAPINCGKVPSPTVAHYGMTHRVPAIMVTGSHIPADRNGIKFNTCSGEILKADETAIRQECVCIKDSLFGEAGQFANPVSATWPVSNTAQSLYVSRYLDTFPHDCLAGQRIGVYQHSAVGRDMLMEVYQGLGAEVVALGRSDIFIPVDTEAIRPEDATLAAQWTKEHALNALVSTDGDSDRPLIADECGQFLRGDVAGILCAKYLGADSVSTPVSCNTAVEKANLFKEVRRTCIGSPFVIASMIEASQAGGKTVVGYEANAGFLTNSDITLFGKTLTALPTRDAIILHLSIMLLAIQEGKPLSALTRDLPQRFTASDRLKDFPQTKSHSLLARFKTGDQTKDTLEATQVFGELCGNCQVIDHTDGARMTFDNSEIVHLRPSGNAPEFRCYTEATSSNRAIELNAACLEVLQAYLKNSELRT